MNQRVALSEITDIYLGQTFRGKAEASDSSSGIRLVQIKDIKEGQLSSLNSLAYANFEKGKKLRVELRNDDLLLPLRGARYEAMVVKIPALEEVVTTTNQVAVIRVNSQLVTLDYLSCFFNSVMGRNALNEIHSGSTIQSINSKRLASLSIDLPSLDIQEKIVAIYQNWLAQKRTIHELTQNGEYLFERSYQQLLGNTKGAY